MATRDSWSPAFGEEATSANVAKLPQGWRGYAQRTTTQSAVGTSPTDLTGLTVTFDVPANRLLKISGYAQGNPSTTATFIVHIVEDGTIIGRVGKSTPVNAVQASLSGFTISAPSAGSHTYKLQGETSTGTVDFEATSTAPMWVLVEDIGSAS